MKVILLENLIKIGSIGDVIEVKRGYTRNYLISKKKALFASKENISEVQKIKSQLSKKDEDRKKEAKSIHEQVKKKIFEVKKLATENKELYGSVKPTEIAKILYEVEKIKINPSLIQPSQDIKSVGTFKVTLNLHPEIQSEISIKVIPEENTK